MTDTAEKRRSAAGVRRHGSARVTPNAAKDQEWRQQVAWSYSGILAAALFKRFVLIVRKQP